MGLTIHYGLRSTAKTSDKAMQLVEKMRQLTLDLPFERVDDEVRYLGPEICQIPLDDLRGDEQTFSTVLDATMHSVTCPWGRKRHMSYSCQPLELVSFCAVPGPGSEWACIGLARYPAELEVTYRPEDDDKFTRTVNEQRSTHWEFDWGKWRRWLVSNHLDRWRSPAHESFHEKRKIKTGLGTGWRYSSFCKTQYASEPASGGLANFLKCHISVITLLDRIAKLPTVKVEVCDEGKYGRSHYSDDWRQARAEGRDPTYVWHEGRYSVPALAQELGEWNEMIAAMCGGLNDMLKVSGSPLTLESPITGFSNFEHLEFKGRENPDLLPLLRAMDELGKLERGRHLQGDAA